MSLRLCRNKPAEGEIFLCFVKHSKTNKCVDICLIENAVGFEFFE